MCLTSVVGCGTYEGHDTDETGSTGQTDPTDPPDPTTGPGVDDGPSPGVELCSSALDPDAYDSPVWSPAPIVGTPQCPAVEGSLTVELSTVELRGRVSFDETQASMPAVWLVGQDGEGSVGVNYDETGRFSTRLAPGRYDVFARVEGDLLSRDVEVVADLDIDRSARIQIDVPPPVTVRGAMTLDGAAVTDPFGHIFIRGAGSEGGDWYAFPLVARMDAGTYEMLVPPGSYEFLYTWCDPAQLVVLQGRFPARHGADDLTAGHGSPLAASHRVGTDFTNPPASDVPPFNPCHDPDFAGFEGMASSPEQKGVPIASDVLITADQQLDLDVTTLRFSGSIEPDGIGPGDVRPYLGTDVGGHRIDGEATFDARVVVGNYAFYGHPAAPPFEKNLVLDHDMHVERTLSAFPVELTLAQDPSLLDIIEAAEVDIALHASVEPFDALYPGFSTYQLPTTEPLRVFAGRYVVAHQQAFCWPDYPGKGLFGWRTVSDDIVFPGPAEIELSLPAVARVAVDYEDRAHPELSGLGLFGTNEGLPPAALFRADGGRLQAHGIWPVGTYRVKGDTVDIVDGTTIRVVEESEPVSIDFLVDGEPTEPDHHFALIPADEDLEFVRYNTGQTTQVSSSALFLPGRYLLQYVGDDEGAVPANAGLELGCVTIED